MYTINLKVDGSIYSYKARLLAKGYTQKYEVDYHETIAPTDKLSTIHILMLVAENKDLPLRQFDLTNE